jgi:sec-independent protein translocase protein TatA
MTPVVAMMMPGAMELGVILVIVVMLFGVGKLPQVFGEMGKGIKLLRDSQQDDL